MPLGVEVGLGPGDFVLDGDPGPPSPKRGRNPPIFSQSLLWPNGWMDQDDTWHGGGPRPRPHCARWRPSSPPQKGSRSPNFRPMSIVAKRLDGSRCQLLYGGKPRPRRHCVKWEPSPPPKRHIPQFSAHVYCGQTAVCIRIPLDTEVGLSLSDIVLDGDPAPPRLRGTAHSFRPMSVVAKRLDGIRCHLVWRYASAQATLCSMGTHSPAEKGHSPYPRFGPCLLYPNGWLDQDATWYRGKPRPRRRCI